MTGRKRIPTAEEIGAKEHGLIFTVLDPPLKAELAAIDAELVRRGERLGRLFMEERHPDLFVRREKAFEAFRTRNGVTTPELKVKPGDFVRLNGVRWLVSSCTPHSTAVYVQRENAYGFSLVSVDIDAEGLEPDPAPPTPEEEAFRERLRDSEKLGEEAKALRLKNRELNLAESLQRAREARTVRRICGSGEPGTE